MLNLQCTDIYYGDISMFLFECVFMFLAAKNGYRDPQPQMVEMTHIC